MSIFQKDCPQCAVPNPVDAVLCACGYCFDPSAVTDSNAAAAVARHEERLYHDYLVARLVQAEAALDVARADAAADRANTYKAAQALAAEQALNAARAELRDHNLMRQAAETRAVTPRRPAEPARRMANKTLSAKRRPPARVEEARADKTPVTALGLPVCKRALSRKVVPAKQLATLPTPATPTALPSRAFRTRQAKKAAAIVRAPAPSAEVPSLVPPAAKPVAAATKECPHCTARVAANLTHCRCGYGFNAGSCEMASLPLDAAALAILRR